mgnify:CR=1 FL=1
MGNTGVCSAAFYDGKCSAEQDKHLEENYTNNDQVESLDNSNRSNLIIK